MKKQLLQIQRGILLALFSFLCVISVKAQTDLTSRITNPSFETGNLTGWTWTGADNYSWLGPNTDGDGTKDGSYICGIWNGSIGDSECAQTLTGLTNGFYKVTALATVCYKGITTQRLFATTSDTTKSMLYGASNDAAYSPANLAILGATETYSFGGYAVSSAENGPFRKLSVVTRVTDASLKIGFRVDGKGNTLGYVFSNTTYGDAGFFKFDNFTLTEVSTVATLDNIILSAGTLDATFSPSTITYTATLPVGTTTVTPTTTVTVDGEVVSGAGAVDVSSRSGSSTILVTALDGTTTKTYTINYTVLTISNDATLSSLSTSHGTLSPAFDPAITTYNVEFNADVTSVTPTAVVNEAHATVSGNGVVTISGGAGTSTILVTAHDGTTTKTYTINYYGCFTPLYSTGNIITDSYCNFYLTNGWGSKSINTNPTYVYCGSSSAYINNGSIDRTLDGTNGNAQMLPNTTYRVKAKVWKVSGTVGIGVWGWSSGQPDIYHEVTTAGSWQDVDFTFTSGATLGGSQGIFFNNGAGYIDNWEMYVTPTFTGTGDWSNTGNWSIGSVPVSTDIVAIDGAATISANTVLNGIIINSGKSLTVSPDKQLTVNTTLTNNGTLNLLSTSDGTATILTPASIGGTGGAVNVQQYLTGGTPDTRCWYLTTPVVGSTSNAFTPATNNLWSYSEAGNSLATVYTIMAADASLTPGTGYVARMVANGNISLSGTSLFNEDITFTNLGYASATKQGFNLIGNPYPCYLDITSAFTGITTFETSAWYSSSTDGISNVFDTFNASTGAGITIQSGVNPASLAIIPPMQAFWVRATNATNSLTFSKTTRSHKPATNGNNLRSAATSDVKQIRLNVSNGTNTDQTLIGFYAQAMDEFDNCDSRKMFNGVANLPEIYSLAGSTIVAINGLPLLTDTREIALGFKTAQAGSFTIKAAEILNLEADQTVILKDKLLNVSQNLTDQPVYSFSSDAVTTTSRFSIVIGKMATALKLAQKSSFEVRALNNGQMEIALDGATQASVKVFDTVGKQVFTQDILSRTSPLSKTFSKGVYLVKVSIGGVENTKKVVINL